MSKKTVRFFKYVSRGFTLVELVVVIAVIGILATLAIVNVPESQKRARDAQRQADLRQLQTKLEEHHNLNAGTYPLSNEQLEIVDHPWGSLWDELNYTVPKDPLSSQSYIYVSDGQSYQVYAKFETENIGSFACATCGLDGEYNGGVAGGSSTELIAWNSEGGSVPTVGPSEETRVKSEVPLVQGRETYFVSGGEPPFLVDLYIDPHDPVVGVTQEFGVHMRDSSPITSVTVVLQTDNGIRTFPLSLTSGTDLDGTWVGSWVVADTHDYDYVFTVRATNQAGQSSKADITIR